MMDMGYPLHLIDLLAKLYRKQLAKVKVAGTLSEWFHVKKGVQQGCVLSPYLFNILAEMVMRETLDGFQGRLQSGGRIVTNLRYADDITLLDTSEAELQELVDRLDQVSRKYSRLLINVEKTKVMASELLDTVKARKLAHYGDTMTKQGSCLEKAIMQGTMSGTRRRGRPGTAWMDNINAWTGLLVVNQITEYRDKWRKYVHGVANPRIEDG